MTHPELQLGVRVLPGNVDDAGNEQDAVVENARSGGPKLPQLRLSLFVFRTQGRLTG